MTSSKLGVGHLGVRVHDRKRARRCAHSVYVRVRMASKGMLLPGYKDTLTDSRSKERYQEKLKLINGRYPYELPRETWKDDVDLWPCTTYIHVGMYLVFSPSAYTGEVLMNYKSLECYQRFIAGWVREILVSVQGETRVLTSKVCRYDNNFN